MELSMYAIRGILLFAALLAVSTAGAENPRTQKTPKRDPKVLALVKQAAELYKNAKSLHVEVDVATNVQNGDDKQEILAHCIYDLEKPNRFALHSRLVKEKDAGIDCISDGKKLLTHALRLKQYTESPAPENLSSLGDKLAPLRRTNTGFLLPNLLTEDPNESLMDDIISCAYAGQEKVREVECHHVKVVHPEIKWEMWIAAKDKPLILKVTTLVAVDEIRVAAAEAYRNWKVDEALDKAVFTITAPADATKVDVLGQQKKSK
jgi:hypothetical protein